jgi:hypothetical protein
MFQAVVRPLKSALELSIRVFHPKEDHIKEDRNSIFNQSTSLSEEYFISKTPGEIQCKRKD